MTLGERYRIERPLAEGGFGAVWVARQMAMNRDVALKVLHRAGNLGSAALKRFYREAITISRLNHPNIVQVFDFGVDAGTRAPFIVFELIEGRTLTEILSTHGALSERRTVAILLQVARALMEAHAQGIVHRDLKPNNVMVTKLRDGARHAKVLDFGLAKIQGEGEDALTGITVPGSAIGSPHFMSPEQCTGGKVDFRCDLYSFGCLLHSMLSGLPPYDGKRAADLFTAHLRAPPPVLPARIPGGHPSPAIIALHRSLLAKSPLARPASAAVLVRILERLAKGEPVDVQTLLDQARQGAFSAAIPPADSLATGSDLTGLSTASSGASGDVPLLDGAETMPPQPAREALAPLAVRKRPSPRRRRWTLGLAGSLCMVVVGIWVGRSLVGEAVDPVVEEARIDPPPPPPSVQGPKPVALSAAPARVRVVSNPPGATIWLGDVQLGVTPAEVAAEAGELRLTARGYRSRRVKVEPDQTEIQVTLERRRDRRRSPPPPEPTKSASKRKYPVW